MVTAVLCPVSAEEKSIVGSVDSGAVSRMYFRGGHPALPDGFEGLVKVTASSVVESGAKSILVGVIRFHGKDFKDINTCTVLIPFISEESG